MIMFLCGMASGAALLVAVALIVTEFEERKRRKSRGRDELNDRFSAFYDRISRALDRIMALERGQEILSKRADCQLEFVKASADLHERVYHAPSPRGDKKAGKKD